MFTPASLATNVVQALRRLWAVNFFLQSEHRHKKGANFVMRLVFSKKAFLVLMLSSGSCS